MRLEKSVLEDVFGHGSEKSRFSRIFGVSRKLSKIMKFWIAYVKIESFEILAALPVAQPWQGLRPQDEYI